MDFNKLALMLLVFGFLVVGCTQQAPEPAPLVITEPSAAPSPAPGPSPAPAPRAAPAPAADDADAPPLPPGDETEEEEALALPEEEETEMEEIVEITMVARKWEFEPATIEVQRGQSVILRIESEDVAHGFAIPELGVDEQLQPGETTLVEFTPGQSGTFTFFCSVFCGAGHPNMRGQLVVTE